MGCLSRLQIFPLKCINHLENKKSRTQVNGEFCIFTILCFAHNYSIIDQNVALIFLKEDYTSDEI